MHPLPAGVQAATCDYWFHVRPPPAVQRVILPEQALVAIQRADLGDVRIYDGRGKPLSLALGGGADEERRSVTLGAMTLRGAAASLTTPGAAIRIEDNGTARVVTIGGAAQADDAVAGNGVAAVGQLERHARRDLPGA